MNTSFSAAKDFNVNLKHIRREFEPELKAAGDHMLASPWVDLESLSKDAQFALSEVMHLSHATHVQEQVIPVFAQENNSVVVEAKTGSGKTLAFIVPVTERLRAQNFQFASKFNTPFLARNICGFIVSPSRVLAQQTFIVGRNFSCRYPFSIKYLLVDRHVEPLEKTAARLSKVARCGGFVAVGTVADIYSLNELLLEQNKKNQNQDDDDESSRNNEQGNNNEESDDDEDESEEDDDDDEFDDDPELKALMQQRKIQMKEKLKAQKQKQNQQKQQQASNKNNNSKSKPEKKVGKNSKAQKQQQQQKLQQDEEQQDLNDDPFTLPHFAPLPSHKFVVVVDEADVVLKDASSYSKLISLCESIQKQNASSNSDDSSNSNKKIEFDFGLYGATATSAVEVQHFTEEFETKFASSSSSTSSSSQLHQVKKFQLSSLENDAADLRNCYEMAPAQNVLQSFIHMLNMHHSKKHFVFFNSIAVLNFVHKLLVKLSRGARPVLRTSQIFALHEGMKDTARFEQFGKFVRYSGLEEQEKRHQNSNGTNANGDQKKPAGSKQGWSESQKEKETMASLGKKTTSGSQHGHNHYFQHATGSAASALSTGAILLCTDEAAFGLDVRDVDYVIHFEPPTSLQSFIHRSGRVARMGMSGTSILLLPETDGAKQFLKQVEEKLFASGERVITKMNVGASAAPIASNIAAYVEDIATDAEEAERQNLAETTSAIVLPSRRSRLVEERLELQAHKNSMSYKPSLDEHGCANAHHSGNANAKPGAKLVARAIEALSKGSSVYNEQEATVMIFSRF